MTIIGLSGDIGSGKSFTQLKWGLETCNRKRKQLVVNFRLNRDALREYCLKRKLNHVAWMIKHGGVSEVVNPNNLQALMIPESVVLLDEAGIFLNSRDFAKTPKSLLAELAQSRKVGIDMIWAAQFMDQVDRQWRLLTQYWIHCDSVSVYDKKTKRPSMKWKRIYFMKCADYNEWLQDRRARRSHWKTRIGYAFDYHGGVITKTDKMLFDCFDSFSRLDTNKSMDRIHTTHSCPYQPQYHVPKSKRPELRLLPIPQHLLTPTDRPQPRSRGRLPYGRRVGYGG